MSKVRPMPPTHLCPWGCGQDRLNGMPDFPRDAVKCGACSGLLINPATKAAIKSALDAAMKDAGLAGEA